MCDTKEIIIKKIEKLLDKIKYGEINIKLGENRNSIDLEVKEIHRFYKNQENLNKLEKKFHNG
jgi:hypothetical protein